MRKRSAAAPVLYSGAAPGPPAVPALRSCTRTWASSSFSSADFRAATRRAARLCASLAFAFVVETNGLLDMEDPRREFPAEILEAALAPLCVLRTPPPGCGPPAIPLCCRTSSIAWRAAASIETLVESDVFLPGSLLWLWLDLRLLSALPLLPLLVPVAVPPGKGSGFAAGLEPLALLAAPAGLETATATFEWRLRFVVEADSCFSVFCFLRSAVALAASDTWAGTTSLNCAAEPPGVVACAVAIDEDEAAESSGVDAKFRSATFFTSVAGLSLSLVLPSFDFDFDFAFCGALCTPVVGGKPSRRGTGVFFSG